MRHLNPHSQNPQSEIHRTLLALLNREAERTLLHMAVAASRLPGDGVLAVPEGALDGRHDVVARHAVGWSELDLAGRAGHFDLAHLEIGLLVEEQLDRRR